MRINLLPEEFRPKPHVTLGNLLILLALVSVTITCMAFATTTVFNYRAATDESANLTDRISQLQSQVEEAKKKEAIFTEVERLQKEAEQIRALYQEHSQIFRKIAAVMPDDIWMTDASIDAGGKVTINGGSTIFPQMGVFLDRINRLNYFKEARFTNMFKEKDTAQDMPMKTYKYTLETKTGRNSLEYGKK